MSNKAPIIKDGNLDIFYGFEAFEFSKSKRNSKKYLDFMRRLFDTGIIVSAEKPDGEVSFTESFETDLFNRKLMYRENEEKKSGIPIYLRADINKKMDEPSVETDNEQRKMHLYRDLEDRLEIAQEKYLQKMVSIYNAEEKHTGIPSKDLKNRFLLATPLIKVGGAEQYCGIYLTVFKQGYVIIHLSMVLNEVDFDKVNSSIWDLPLENVKVPELIIKSNKSYKPKKKARCNTLHDLILVYKEFIVKHSGLINLNLQGEFLRNISLFDYSYIPSDYNQEISDDLYFEFYKLLHAPITEFTLKTNQETRSVIENRYYSFSKGLRVLANSNRLIVAGTKSLQKDINKLVDDGSEKEVFHNTSLGAVINAIELILIKKLSIQKHSVYELMPNTSLARLINLTIKENSDFSLEFSKYFYTFGSVRSLIHFMEEACEDFLQQRITSERRNRLEKLINLKKERYIASFAVAGPILTIAITLLVSYPAIKQVFVDIDKKHLVLPVYITSNLLLSIFMILLVLPQIKDFYYEITTLHIPYIKRVSWIGVTEIYIKADRVAVSFREHKERITEGLITRNLERIKQLIYKFFRSK